MALSFSLPTIVKMGKSVCRTRNRFLSLGMWRHGAVVPFKLSDIGEGIREVTIKEWFVSPGDKVAQFDQICEVQSDKASVTITSRYDGRVRALHYKIDEMALVGDSLIDIELDEESSGVPVEMSDDNTSCVPDEIAIPPISNLECGEGLTNIKSSLKILTTPAVRRIAWENKIDLRDVVATGKNGRILKEDLLRYLEKSMNEKSEKIEMEHPRNFVDGVTTVENMALKGYAKHMWKSMTRSLTIPHFVYSDECDVTKLVIYRNEVKNYFNEQNVSLTFMPFFIKAASRVLHEFPHLNALLDEDSKCLKIVKEHNVSVAMDTPEGLVVPNIKNVQNLSIVEISKELNRLQELGRKSSIPLNDITGGTFSLSNIGVIGGTYTKPVIFSPQVVIGAIGRIQKLPRFDADENVIAANILSISWAADHRVVDGVTMAKFSNRWKYFIENPAYLVL